MRLLWIVFLEGFVTVSVEVLAIRQLIPAVGSNVIVTSFIIGIFLLFLAVGYHRGGMVVKNFEDRLFKNFLIAMVFIGFGLSYAFIATFFYFAKIWLPINDLLILCGYLLLVVAPIVYFLGQTIPITTNLIKSDKTIGAISGQVLSLSTLGSFLGSVLTSLLLFHFLGVAASVFVNCAILVILTFMLTQGVNHRAVMLFVGVGLLMCMWFLNIGHESERFIVTNEYANYEVIDDFQYGPYRVGKLLSINDSRSSFYSKDRKAGAYLEFIKRRFFKGLKVTDKDVLVIGAGGFVLTAETDFGNRFTYIDVDPKIKEIVEQHYLSPIPHHFHGEDARTFIKNSKTQYDVILSDAYTNRFTIPSYLLTKDYFEQLRARLRPGGYALFNMIINPTLSDRFSKRVDNTIRSVFKNCTSSPLAYVNETTNIIYICNMNDREEDGTIYTDDMNAASIDSSA